MARSQIVKIQFCALMVIAGIASTPVSATDETLGRKCLGWLVSSGQAVAAQLVRFGPRQTTNPFLVESALMQEYPALEAFLPIFRSFHVRRDQEIGRGTYWGHDHRAPAYRRYTFRLREGLNKANGKPTIGLDLTIQLSLFDDYGLTFSRALSAFDLWLARHQIVKREGPFESLGTESEVFAYDVSASPLRLSQLTVARSGMRYPPETAGFHFESEREHDVLAAASSFLDFLFQSGWPVPSDEIREAIVRTRSAHPRRSASVPRLGGSE